MGCSSCVSGLTHWPSGLHFTAWWKLFFTLPLGSDVRGKKLSLWTCRLQLSRKCFYLLGLVSDRKWSSSAVLSAALLGWTRGDALRRRQHKEPVFLQVLTVPQHPVIFLPQPAWNMKPLPPPFTLSSVWENTPPPKNTLPEYNTRKIRFPPRPINSLTYFSVRWILPHMQRASGSLMWDIRSISLFSTYKLYMGGPLHYNSLLVLAFLSSSYYLHSSCRIQTTLD